MGTGAVLRGVCVCRAGSWGETVDTRGDSSFPDPEPCPPRSDCQGRNRRWEGWEVRGGERRPTGCPRALASSVQAGALGCRHGPCWSSIARRGHGPLSLLPPARSRWLRACALEWDISRANPSLPLTSEPYVLSPRRCHSSQLGVGERGRVLLMDNKEKASSLWV